jgi:hypothetical protein
MGGPLRTEHRAPPAAEPQSGNRCCPIRSDLTWVVNVSSSIEPDGYSELLSALKAEIRAAQLRAHRTALP